MSRYLFPIAMLVLASSVSSASAQADEAADFSETFTQTRSNYDLQESEIVMQKFADCVANRTGLRDKLDNILSASPADPGLTEAIEYVVFNTTCSRNLSASLATSTQLWRYALFDAHFRAQSAELSALDVSAIPPLDLGIEGYPVGDDLKRDEARLVLNRLFSDCVMRVDIGWARQLLIADIRSEEETTALQALMPAMGECLPQGTELGLSRTILRGGLAEAFHKAHRSQSTRFGDAS